MPLQRKLLLVLLPLVVLPLLVVAWFAYHDLRDQRLQDVNEELIARLAAVQHGYEALRASALANTRLFAANVLVKRYARTKDSRDRYDLIQPALIRQFKQYQAVYKDYYEIRYIDPDGFEDTRVVDEPLANQSQHFRIPRPPPGKRRRALSVWYQLAVNPDNGKLALYVVAPVRLLDTAVDPANRKFVIGGYIVVTVGLGSVIDAASRESAKGKRLVQLVDDHGRMVNDRAGPTAARVSGVGSNAAATGSFIKANEQQTNEDFRRRLRLDGDLYAVAIITKANTLAGLQALFWEALFVTVVSVFLVSSLTVGFLKRVVLGPIGQLCEATRLIGLGEEMPPLVIRGSDELGQLARSVEDMKVNLDRSRARVVTLAQQDQLTGLPNRRAFQDRLDDTFMRARRAETGFALMFLDIDNFKAVNDSMGHPVGDELLRQVGHRLSTVIRRGDDGDFSAISRIGGDEFLILLWGVDEVAAATTVAKRIFALFQEPFHLASQLYYVRASIGIAFYPESGDDTATLIRHADMAMYAAKGKGKNRYHFFNELLNIEAQRRMALIGRLETAVDRNELRLVYQPKILLAQKRITGAEVLVRWHNPELGDVGPAEFIPVAEQTGIIHAIGEWVLEGAMRQLRAWTGTSLADYRLAVNISAVQLAGDGLRHYIADLVERYGVHPSQVELELTETALIDDPGTSTVALRAFKELGFAVSLDDFGTGYASLSELNRLPIDELKIDRAFVNDLGVREEADKIVVGVVAMAHSMGLRVIAEGVETREQERLLEEIGCDAVQGFLYAEPMAADVFEQFVADWAAGGGEARPAGV